MMSQGKLPPKLERQIDRELQLTRAETSAGTSLRVGGGG